jgi:hypothetical protein
MIRLTKNPDTVDNEGHRRISDQMMLLVQNTTSLGLFYVKRRYLGGLDKNLSTFNDLIHSYYLAYPKKLDELLEKVKGLMIVDAHIKKLLDF